MAVSGVATRKAGSLWQSSIPLDTPRHTPLSEINKPFSTKVVEILSVFDSWDAGISNWKTDVVEIADLHYGVKMTRMIQKIRILQT
jgi:hypothetical protein